MQFDNCIGPIRHCDLKDWKPLKRASGWEKAAAHQTDPDFFVPFGRTALLDAIGHAVDATGVELAELSEQERPARVIVAIITDGLENASNRFTRAEIADKIRYQSDVYKWQFVFLGANQDASRRADSRSGLRWRQSS